MGFTGEVLSAKSHSEEFTCSICVNLVDLNESVMTVCSHVFCWSCLSEWIKVKRTCPYCNCDLSLVGKSPQYLKQANPLAWRVLSRVRVKCPLECSWQGDYSELQAHLTSSTEHKGVSARESALRLKEQGNEKYTSKNFKDALLLFNKAISLCDDIPALFSNRAAVYLSLGNYAEALADCRKTIEMDPAFEKAYFRGAKCLVQLGRFPEARAFVSQAPRSLQDRSPALRQAREQAESLSQHLVQARQEAAQGNWPSAREHTVRLLAETQAPAILLLAAQTEAYLGSCERALKLGMEVLRKDPNEPAAYTACATAMLFSGQVDSSVKYIKEALVRSPDDKDASALFKLVKPVRTALSQARAAVSAGDYEQAVELFTQVASDPKLPPRCVLVATALAERANGRFRLKQYDSALSDCARAIYIQHDSERAWLTKAYVLHAQGRHEDALKELGSVMETWGSNNAVVKGAYEKAQFEVKKAARPDYYALLTPEKRDQGTRALSCISSEMEIKAAYKHKALECHPDRFANASPEEHKKREEEFKLIGEAFEILTDSFKRQLYDKGFDKQDIEERIRRAERQHGGGGGHGHGHHHHHH